VPGVGDHHAAARGLVLRFGFDNFTGAGSWVDGIGAEFDQQCITFGGRVSIGFRLAGFKNAHQSAQLVAAAQQEAGQVAGYPDFTVAQAVENVFHLVHEVFDEMTFDNTGSSFNGVGGAENGVDVVEIVRVLLKYEQAVFHGLQLLAAFLDKYAGQFVHGLPQACSWAEMMTGSPKKAARLQKSMV